MEHLAFAVTALCTQGFERDALCPDDRGMVPTATPWVLTHSQCGDAELRRQRLDLTVRYDRRMI